MPSRVIMPSPEQCMRYIEILMEAGNIEPPIASEISRVVQHYVEEWTNQATAAPDTPIAIDLEQELQDLAWAVYYGFEDVVANSEDLASYTLANYERVGLEMVSLLDNHPDRTSVLRDIRMLHEELIPSSDRCCRKMATLIRWYARWLEDLEGVAPEMPRIIKRIHELASDVLEIEVTRGAKIGELRHILSGVWRRLHLQL